MKKFYLLILTLVSLTNTKAQMLFTVSVSQPTQCYSSGNNTLQATVVNTVSGATNYTWIATSSGTCLGAVTLIGNGQTANIAFPCCGVFNVYCSAINNTITPGTPFTIGSSVVITTIACVAPISVSGSSAECQGSTSHLMASGSTNYTWQPGNLTTFSINPVVNANTCFTVRGTAANGCTNSAVHCVSVSPTPTLSFSGNTLVCAGAPTTLSVSGANNYTWYIGASATTGSVLSVSPTAATCYSVKGANSTGCFVYAGVCVSVTPSSIAIVGPNGVCPGGSLSLVASGAQNYTWMPGNITGSLVTITPTANICFTVISTNTTGCSGPITKCLSIFPNPLVSVSGGSFCIGQPRTLNATGAFTYTWLPFGLTGSSVVISPTANVCYSVIGMTSAGCVGTASNCLVMGAVPSISATAPGSVCLGSTILLTASGATSYTWKPVNLTGATVSVTPTAINSCYTVVAGVTGCTNAAVVCVNVVSTSLTVSPLSYSVCKGSSATFSAGGANTYTWTTGANTSTVNVIPTSSTFYNVYGIGANGCIGFRSVSVTVNPNCSDVWPGDANSDGIVSNIDIFELGLAYLNTGPARVPGGNTYNSQFANNWTGTISTGKNKCHADCDGNGVVSLSDTLAIHNNFLLNHPFKPSTVTDATADLSISPAIGLFNAGAWNKVDLMLSDDGQSIPVITGAAFDLNFDPSLIETDSLYLVYTPSFINAGNQNINFRKSYFLNGVVYAATVRTDGSDVNGSGKIAELHFKVKTGIPLQSVLNFSITNASRVSQNGTLTGITGGASALSQVALGIKNTNAEQSGFIVFPNPASDRVTLATDSSGTLSYQIHDIAGRLLIDGKFVGTKTLDVSALANGTYVLRITSGDNAWHNKLIVNK